MSGWRAGDHAGCVWRAPGIDKYALAGKVRQGALRGRAALHSQARAPHPRYACLHPPVGPPRCGLACEHACVLCAVGARPSYRPPASTPPPLYTRQRFPNAQLEPVTCRLPEDRWHGDRYMRFGPDGLLYVPVGAPCNACPERRSPQGIVYSSIYALNVTEGDEGLRLYARGAPPVAWCG